MSFVLFRPLVVLLILYLVPCISACDLARQSENHVAKKGARAPSAPTAPELNPAFLTRGHSALLERVGSQAQLLEMRAQGRQLSYIVLMGERLEQIDYVEQASLTPGSESQTKNSAGIEKSAPAGTAVGKIYGPDPVEVLGDGPLEENVFDLTEVNLTGITRSFAVALRAVDPDHGRVTGLVVRRFLPFSTAIRARIYVDSPKMSGSIDTNERGIPLKRR